MADGDSVSEADFDAFAPSTDALVRQQLTQVDSA